VYDTYDNDNLKKIFDFLKKEIEHSEMAFVQGKGTRKTTLQKDYETMFDYVSKLQAYSQYIEMIGPNRSSCSKTDHDTTFMHMKEDYMRNSQLKAGYNVQIDVSSEYILHLDIFKDRNDY
jgi:hypothetical protein